MTTDRELMQFALDALDRSDYLGWQFNISIVKALRERLAQPEMIPITNGGVATLTPASEFFSEPEPAENEQAVIDQFLHNNFSALNTITAPPKREWVGLTDEDYEELLETKDWGGSLIKATEAKLKEKNHG